MTQHNAVASSFALASLLTSQAAFSAESALDRHTVSDLAQQIRPPLSVEAVTGVVPFPWQYSSGSTNSYHHFTNALTQAQQIYDALPSKYKTGQLDQETFHGEMRTLVDTWNANLAHSEKLADARKRLRNDRLYMGTSYDLVGLSLAISGEAVATQDALENFALDTGSVSNMVVGLPANSLARQRYEQFLVQRETLREAGDLRQHARIMQQLDNSQAANETLSTGAKLGMFAAAFLGLRALLPGMARQESCFPTEQEKAARDYYRDSGITDEFARDYVAKAGNAFSRWLARFDLSLMERSRKAHLDSTDEKLAEAVSLGATWRPSTLRFLGGAIAGGPSTAYMLYASGAVGGFGACMVLLPAAVVSAFAFEMSATALFDRRREKVESAYKDWRNTCAEVKPHVRLTLRPRGRAPNGS
jgi:hypothetical protein